MAVVVSACSVKPEPLAFGKDPCHTCKMTLIDSRFGAEILTLKGKIYKFDDLNCMIQFYQSEYEPKENIGRILVVDFDDPGTLIDAQTAHYIQADAIRSPMSSQVAAFSSENASANHNKEWNGKAMNWEQLVSVIK